MGRKPKTERNAEIAAMIENGATLTDAAEKFDISKQRVRQILSAHHPDAYDAVKKTRTSTSKVDIQAIVDFVFSDDNITLAEAGEKFGISGERIRQIAVAHDPVEYAKRQRRRKAVTALRNEMSNLRQEKVCRCCGESFYGRGINFCCEEHRLNVNIHLRYHIDDDYRNKHLEMVADWVGRNPDKVSDNQQRFAERVRNGEAKRKGRWFVEGSKAFRIAQEACVKHWPVFAQLPPGLQEQVKKSLDMEVTTGDPVS